ncbi:4'-phosphopantetheinyl transferase family protein [Pseudotabrizicola algicola]|uniref:Enterobactin synthase component D n=1 Tax=Pseudotabrizicola algicola TaxID=2709381 RepID=A0A6B3RLA0_9RHOB|nr:4'-phosphopantetheinyl transferase superfamily protein [Pseudotabrizicola algicola]NEX46820.1 4'-phosphopantetheinyl transferase superfamily protein [Pseudotabrizicola algicola]
MPDAALLAALRGIVPAGAGLGRADPRADHPLLAGEAIAGAVPARLREFAAGRAAARRAMAAIGEVAAQAIPMGADRAPQWPPAVTGSITHTDSHCLAVALPSTLCRGIGIDLEADTPLDMALWDVVLRPDERDGMTGAQAKAIFCAKEAAYKAQYAQSRQLFGFDTLHVTFAGNHFAATFTRDVPPFCGGDRIAGSVLRVAGHLLAAAHIPPHG